MRHLYIFLIFTFLSAGAIAQQYPLFTNYMMNRYGYNPAINTDTSGVIANLVYRKQWVGIEGAPVTQIGGLRGKVKSFPIGLGGYFFNDHAGVIGRKGGYGMFNFVQQVGADTRLSVGASLGFYAYKLDEEHKVSDAFDQVVPQAIDGMRFVDFNAGFYVQHKNAYLGFSVPQVTEKKIDFSDLEDKSILLRHYFILAGYKHKLNDKVRIEPSGLIKYVQNAPMQWDAGVKLGLNQFYLGAIYRSSSAFNLMAGVDLGKFDVCYSYDLATNGLAASSTGSHELSLELRFGQEKDTDKDGCPDKDDKCPDKPGPKENDCCPEEDKDELLADVDTDGDGCPDKDDKCPKLAGPKENDCCPFGDRDGDGVRDDIDKCPDLPGVASNYGCPIDDRDHDGIVDKFDKCPDEPGPLRNEGCPGEPDTDGDGIADKDDRCPNTKGVPDNEGCPRTSPADMEILNLAIRNLYFDTNKSDIWKESYPFLNKLSEILVKNPDWGLKIQGHADHRASSEYNLALSKRRAEAVYFYLQNRGVKRDQIEVEYYGEDTPASSQASEGALQMNRRVEMEFYFK